MHQNNTHLYDLVNPIKPQDVLDELFKIYKLSNYDPDQFKQIERVHNDILSLFNGEYPGYQASNTKYHNLEHTCSVVLSTARLLHGSIVSQFCEIDEKYFILGVLSAYFHDTGLIKEVGDNDGTGAKYTLGHEERSIRFMTQYLTDNGYPEESIQICEEAIRATILSLRPSEIPFSTIKSELIARIVGSADLISQIADRTYLEKLALLFAEFSEARLPGFSTELDLLKQTEDFYSNIAKKRLEDDFNGIHRHFKSHFIHRWNIDEDLYAKSIEANISYISGLVDTCGDNYMCYQENLRRSIG